MASAKGSFDRLNLVGWNPNAKRVIVMGILNVTPDSFSDGGDFSTVERAVAQGLAMVEEGADMIDVGGESTRPGADPVTVFEEILRVEPVIRELRKRTSVPISVDTTKSAVARRALAAGADMVNDISACRFDPKMVDVLLEFNAPVVLMHMKGAPKDMQTGDLSSNDIVGETCDFLTKRVEELVQLGIKRENLWIDPGIGFGKTVAQNFEICRGLDRYRSIELPILFGISRKSCLGAIVDKAPKARDAASLAAHVLAVQKGVSALRVHNVADTVDALKVLYELDR